MLSFCPPQPQILTSSGRSTRGFKGLPVFREWTQFLFDCMKLIVSEWRLSFKDLSNCVLRQSVSPFSFLASGSSSSDSSFFSYSVPGYFYNCDSELTLLCSLLDLTVWESSFDLTVFSSPVQLLVIIVSPSLFVVALSSIDVP